MEISIENKARLAFVAVALLGAAAALGWFFVEAGRYVTYQIPTQDSVSGLIGDAPGDYKAAKSNGALFYPINPGNEEVSWQRFYQEALDRFFAGTYAGEYEARLVKEFDACLPERPNWQ